MKDKSTKNLTKSRNIGSIENNTQIPDKDGDVMTIATKDVISIPPSKSIKEATEVMMEHHFRRLPVTDAGSGKLLGIVTVMDILDFLGGGKKFNIIVNTYDDNFLQAINEPIREIMTRDVITVTNKDSIDKAIDTMLDHYVGAVPILNAERKLVGIITERDISLSFAGVLTEQTAEDVMSNNVISTTPGTPIEGACKIMVRNSFRRIPIIGGREYEGSEKKLLGIITTTNIVNYLNDKKLFTNMASNNATDVLNATVSDIMADKVCTVEPTTRLGEICEIFKERNIGGLPVTKNDAIIGIVTERDILRAVKK
ncbi:MAG: CBS domain-containing protein [archaeon]|nr:CBS domain-containing protein [archaeon]